VLVPSTFLVLTLNSYAQKKSINLIDSVLNDLKIKKAECLTKFILKQNISISESVIFIPKIAEKDEEGDFTLDAYLLIVNNQNGKIKSIFSKTDCWYSDAVQIENVSVIYQPYRISKKSETIGILIEYNGSSRINPYSSKELTIFERKGKIIKRVLEDFPIYTLNGENDGNSNGEEIEHIKFIKPKIDSKIKFYNLKVTDSIIKTEYNDGFEKIIDKTEKIEKLEYKNGKYKNVL